jgi:hypothetical protein
MALGNLCSRTRENQSDSTYVPSSYSKPEGLTKESSWRRYAEQNGDYVKLRTPAFRVVEVLKRV